MRRERLHRARPGSGRGRRQHLALDRLHRADQAGGVTGQRIDGDRVGPVRVHQAGHLDDRLGVQHGQRGAVADVEDERGAFVAGDGPHQREGHVLVTAGEVLGGALTGARGLPVLRHVGGLAFGAGAVPQVEGGRVRAGRAGVERGLLLQQEGAAGLLDLPVGPDGLPVEVVVVQVLVGDRAEGAQPVGTEEPALLEGAEQFGIGEQAREFVAPGDTQTPDPAEVVEADVVDPRLGRVGAEGAGDAAAESDG